MRALSQCGVALITIVLTANFADAAILSHVSGNSRAAGALAGTYVDGSVSFAVFSRTGAAGDVFGTGLGTFDTSVFSAGVNALFAAGPAFDTTAAFLYAYQLVNDGISSVSIRELTISLNGQLSSAVTSWGYFGGLGFTDGALVGAGNPFGNDGPFDAPPGSAPADVSGVLASPYVAAAVPGQVPNLAVFNGVLNANGQITVSFNPLLLGPGQRSPLIVFTSNIGPTMITAPMQDGGAAPASFTVPTLSPAPNALVLMLAGSPGLAFALRRRRRSTAA